MKNILIVEDDEVFGKMIVDLVTQAGFMPTWAVDALQGQQAVSSTKPDLIILDLMLPAGNGVQLLRNFRSSMHTQSIPVVVTTSYKDPDVQKEIEEIGVQAYFIKPFDQGEFLSKVKVILA